LTLLAFYYYIFIIIFQLKYKKEGNEMKGSNGRLLLTLAAALALAVLAACGGGGGGGGGVESIAYTGITNQASITSGNAEELATEAYLGGEAGSQMGGMFGVVGSGSQAPAPRHLAFAEMLVDTVQGLDVTAPAVGATESGSMPCDTGNISYTMTINETTGAFTGSFRYNSCTNGSQTMNGSVTWSGTMDMGGGSNPFTNMTMTFGAVTVTDGGTSVSFGGSMTMTMSGSTATMNMDMRIRENGSGTVIWVNDYSVAITPDDPDFPTYEDITVSGRFYDPVHGFVDITTIAPLRVNFADEYPSQGQLRFDGLGGTYARLVVIDNTQCQVLADTDGNTTEDYDSGPINWADL
jgi:hypothetical protein